MNSKRQFIGAICMFSGTLLGVASLLGAWTPLGHYRNHSPRPWERFDAELVDRLRTVEDVLQQATTRLGRPLEQASPEAAVKVLYELVTERFTHDDARHNFFSNWILWAFGFFKSDFAHIRDPETMIAHGHSLFCDQSSYLLLHLLQRSGLQGRHVGLGGHVVMEAWYDGDWHLYDPDMEVLGERADRLVEGVEQISKNPTLLRRLYGGPKTPIIPILESRQDNTFMSYPAGSWFGWKSQVLSLWEAGCEMLKWLFPLAALTGGYRLVRSGTSAW